MTQGETGPAPDAGTGPAAAPAPGASRRRRARRWAAVAIAVLLCALAIDYWAYPYGSRPGGQPASRGEDGLWLRYTWYFGERSDADLARMARRVRRLGIRDAYFHVRFIRRDGRLAFRYADAGRARRLTAAFRRLAPGARAIAWVYAGNARGQGEVDLSRGEVRAAMVREAVWLVEEGGFDGVQWDYEICPDGDVGFLELLEETRAGLPPRAVLGCAAPVWLPAPVGRWGWSEAYYRQVASRCDQVAVMCYDTGFVLPRAYVRLARQQVARVCRAARAGSPRCRVLMGVPTYGRGLRSHNPRAENIALALRGVREGLARAGPERASFAGVAIFADYTTDEAEWATYERLWAPPRRAQPGACPGGAQFRDPGVWGASAASAPYQTGTAGRVASLQPRPGDGIPRL